MFVVFVCCVLQYYCVWFVASCICRIFLFLLAAPYMDDDGDMGGQCTIAVITHGRMGGMGRNLRGEQCTPIYSMSRARAGGRRRDTLVVTRLVGAPYALKWDQWFGRDFP